MVFDVIEGYEVPRAKLHGSYCVCVHFRQGLNQVGFRMVFDVVEGYEVPRAKLQAKG